MSEQLHVFAENLAKIYKKGDTEIKPLDGLDLKVSTGEFLALMGPSGSGKSTLLHVVGGIDKPDSGICRVADYDVTQMSVSQLCSFRSANIGFVFQSLNLIPVLTAYENIELPLRLLPVSAKRRRAQVKTALEIVGLADRANHLPSQLSGGQEQRVAIARALATDPVIILADEPTGDLDEESGNEIVAILRELSAEHGKSVIMVTHDATKAKYADRILYFDHGRLSEENPRMTVAKGV
jgi:putative ABC transport system ATP-binding protein